jgi:hypothetical protein
VSNAVRGQSSGFTLQIGNKVFTNTKPFPFNSLPCVWSLPSFGTRLLICICLALYVDLNYVSKSCSKLLKIQNTALSHPQSKAFPSTIHFVNPDTRSLILQIAYTTTREIHFIRTT